MVEAEHIPTLIGRPISELAASRKGARRDLSKHGSLDFRVPLISYRVFVLRANQSKFQLPIPWLLPQSCD